MDIILIKFEYILSKFKRSDMLLLLFFSGFCLYILNGTVRPKPTEDFSRILVSKFKILVLKMFYCRHFTSKGALHFDINYFQMPKFVHL